MLGKIISFGRAVTPSFLMPVGQKLATWLIARSIAQKNKRGLKAMLNYYAGRQVTPEEQEVLDYLNKHEFDMFPYEFLHQQKPTDIKVLFDSELRLPYLLFENKRLYYPDDATEANIQQVHYIDQILAQHPRSPHRYLADDLTVDGNDVVVDCGAADGNFSLDVVDKVKKIYLFEPAARWQKPLSATFAPWKHKVVIVPKLLSNDGGKDSISLDEYFADKDEKPTLIKMDIEGYERVALQSAQSLLRSANGIRKAAICTYHRQDDERDLGAYLRECGFKTTPAKGFMLYFYDEDIKPPYFRRGVIRAIKG